MEIAYCGLACEHCPAFTATKKNDLAALEKLAVEWSAQFGMPMTAADVRCAGCKASDGPHIGHCAQCAIRACAVKKAVPNCAHCDSYGCETLKDFIDKAEWARLGLEKERASLGLR